MRRRHATAIVALALALCAGEAAAQTPAQLEQRGEFRAALQMLDRQALTGRAAGHREALRAAVEGLVAADFFAAQGNKRAEQAVLAALQRRLDPVRDAYVRTAVDERIDPPEEESFLGKVGDDLAGIALAALTWALALAGVAALIWLGLWLQRQRRPIDGVRVMLDDLSVDAADRASGSEALGRELEVAIDAAGGWASDPLRAEVDVAKDLDGGVSVNVRVVGDDVAALGSFVAPDQTIAIGPLAVSPKQLAAFVRGTVARRYTNELRGALAVSPSGARLSVTLVSGEKATSWTSSAAGDDARAAVVADTAARILFELGPKETTKSWPSAQACREAVHCINTAGEDREGALKQARRLLERALRYDPGNVIARLELGNVLRKLGANEDAVKQYDVLEQLCAAGDGLPMSARRAATYSRAVTLTKIRTWRSTREAIELLQHLAKEVDADPALSDEERRRLGVLERSAFAAARVVELEATRYEPRSERLDKRRQTALEEIRAACQAVEEAAEGQFRVWPGYAQALAVAENAKGRALYLMRTKSRDAIAAFERALSLAPDLGDAHVNLASALLRVRGGLETHERIRRHLEEALALSPRDRKAHYLLGQLELDRGEETAAREWFNRAVALGDTWALHRLAQLDWNDGRRTDALEQLTRSLAQDWGIDRRGRTLVMLTTQALDGNLPVPPSALNMAKRVAKQLNKQAASPPTELAAAITRVLAA